MCVWKEQVRRPRSSKLVHRIDAVNPHTVTQISVPLMLSRSESHRGSPVHSSHMIHSASSPVLQGAWNMRTLEHAVPPPLATPHRAGIFV